MPTVITHAAVAVAAGEAKARFHLRRGQDMNYLPFFARHPGRATYTLFLSFHHNRGLIHTATFTKKQVEGSHFLFVQINRVFKSWF
jgi:hypothetical protein